MKKFQFPLDRVLAWRQTQVRLEEAALDRLRGELDGIDRRRVELDQAVLEARDRLLGSASATGPEIAALEHYRAAATQQALRLAHERHEREQAALRQAAAVQERRREARLLERLRDRRWEAWRAQAAREWEQQAEESHLARLVRGRRPE